MADFMDKLASSFGSAGKVLSDKFNDTSNLAKLNIELKSKQTFIEKQYISIGKKVYELENQKEETALEEVFLIRQTLEEIKEIRHEIMEIKGMQKCPHCGVEIEKAVRYCPNCGKSVEEDEDTVETADFFTEEKEAEAATEAEAAEEE
jgi:uncharacterized protein (UPF0212 family)